MTTEGISEDVKQFIFEHIDSIEQLEVLLFMRRNAGRGFTSKAVADDMRRNPDSAEQKISALANAGFLVGDKASGHRYIPPSPEIDAVIEKLDEAYRIRPHKLFELIFSPMKKARGFADAFMVKRKKNEDSDG